MEELKKVLEQEILEKTKELKRLKLGTEEYALAEKSLSDLYKVYLDYEKQGWEVELLGYKEDVRMDEQKLKAESDEEEKKWRIIELISGILTTAFSISVPLWFHGRWMKRTFDFEKNGTISSETGKTIMRRLFRLK